MQVAHMSALVFPLPITAVYKKKNCPTHKESAFFLYLYVLFWDGRRARRGIERREKILGKDWQLYYDYPLQSRVYLTMSAVREPWKVLRVRLLEAFDCFSQ